MPIGHRPFKMDKLADYKEILAEICDRIGSGKECRGLQKGVIVADNGEHEFRVVTEECLSKLPVDRISVLDIDASWTHLSKTSVWNRLVEAAYRANDGLLVLNISSITIFKYVREIKQLVKQENPLVFWHRQDDPTVLDIQELNNKAKRMRYAAHSEDEVRAWLESRLNAARRANMMPSEFDFRGYVIFLISGISPSRIREYVAERNQGGEWSAFNQFLYRLY